MGALDGIRVLSFNHFLSGPAAAQHLGDLGADVIAVEPLTGAFQRNWAVGNRFVDGVSVNHMTTGRNKRSIAVDLKSPEGIAAVKRLVATADVVMENFRPGTLEKLGLGEDVLRGINPGLVYAATTGFGPDGPYAKRPGQDILLQAMTGLAAHTGSMEHGPVAVGSVPIDHHAAALTVAGILAALLERGRTGKGRRVEVNMLQAAIDLQGESVTAWLNGAEHAGPRGQKGMANWFSPGPYGIYGCTDGHVMISMSTPSQIGKALDLPQIAGFSDKDGFDRRGEVSSAVAVAMARMALDEALPKLEVAGVWHEVVRDYDSLRGNPQLTHLGGLIDTQTRDGSPMTLVASPIRMDGAPGDVRLPPQALGAQTREVLAEAGYSETEIDALLEGGAVAQTDRMSV